MDIYQFYNSASRLALAIESSGLMEAVKTCRARLAAGDSHGETNRSLAEALLLRASSDYIEHVERFTADDHLVAEHFHLHTLAFADYWAGLTDDSASAGNRLGELVSLYSRLMFASSHLPRLLSLIRESDSGVADGQTGPSEVGTFVLELADLQVPANNAASNAASDYASEELESAADPDRIARVIDGANMVYQGAALLAGGSPESLKLESITGYENRTLVFRGQQEAATAVRRIIRHLSAIPTIDEDANGEAGSNSSVDAERRVEDLPFLSSLHELERIGALSGELIGDIRSSVVAGSIMLVEAGVVLAERDRNWPSNGAAWPLAGSLSGAAPDKVETEVEAHYLDHFEAVRNRMLGEVTEVTVEQGGEQGKASTARQPQKTTVPELSDESTDDLDDLIVDLNRLYKR